MSKDANSTALLSQQYIDADQRSFWETVLMLYRYDATWRSALDMVLIGSLMLCFANGLPMDFLQSSQQDTATPPGPIAGSGTPSGATSPAANFSPASTQNNTRKVPLAVPTNYNKLPEFVEDKAWFTPLDSDQEAILLDAYADISNYNCETASDKLHPGAENGNADFQMALAISYICNKSEPDNKLKAFYWQNEAAEAGNPYAQYELAQYYRLGLNGLPNIENARIWYEKAMANGHAGATHELGRIYESGNGVTRDWDKAFHYYKLGAEGGNKYAQNMLSAIYYNGVHVPRDLPKAIDLAQKSADQNLAEAQLNLARLYYRGRISGNVDYSNFTLWAGKAADQGDISAMLELADFYLEGKEGAPDNQLAAQWYRKAALKKNAKAQFMLARLYENGTGVPQDDIQAYVYYSLAHHGGFGQARSAAEKIAGRMQKPDIDHAKRLADALRNQ